MSSGRNLAGLLSLPPAALGLSASLAPATLDPTTLAPAAPDATQVTERFSRRQLLVICNRQLLKRGPRGPSQQVVRHLDADADADSGGGVPRVATWVIGVSLHGSFHM